MTARYFLLTALLATATGLSADAAPAPATAPASPRVTASVSVPAPTRQQLDFFEAKVRPVLSANCYKCHSGEQGKAKGDLILDTREGWAKGGEHGAAVTPGDPTKSLLIHAIEYDDADLQMPPNGKKLSNEEIAALTAWVKMGAPDPRTAPAVGGGKLTGLTDKARSHWAYQPVKKPEVPHVANATWGRTPVDAFVLNKLESNGMKPNPPATKEALIRRATYDLVGLPPTPEEVRAFVLDTAPNAFEKVVDRLLASPQYGERWGRFWLDTARYSDTSGLEKAKGQDYRYAYAWTYRDYVINSFNDDKPYDQFLKEQIAADQLPASKNDPARLAALGFITVGKRFQNPNDTLDERIDALGKATMGMTVACARCHDHKFDPIPTADYYSLRGVFASTVEPDERPMIGAAPTGPDYDDFKQKMAELEKQNKAIYYDLIEAKSSEFRKKAGPYLLVATYGKKGQGAALTQRNKIIAENRLEKDILQAGLRGIRKDVDVLSPLALFARLPEDQFAAKAKDVLATIAEGGTRRRPINALVVDAFKQVAPGSLRNMNDVAAVYSKLFAEIDPKAKAYIRAVRLDDAEQVKTFPAALVELIEMPASIEPAASLTTEHLREIAPRLPVANNNAYNRFVFSRINELEMTHPGSPPRAMSVVDASEPRDSAIFIRGEATNRGRVVPRQFLEILSGKDRQPFKIGSGRLELAQDIASKNNPLTARVLVNRVWMHHFGEGFVRTPDDLGVQSEPPSHPELLDYLAARFTADASAGSEDGLGWSVKKLHKLIMLSAVYQESADTNPQYAQTDPDNRLLWRSNLRRLDFEAIRDSMVQFSGKLDLTIGGKPVNLTDEPYSNRRSVYGYIDRGDLPELMAQFDFSDPDMANSRRATTIVPQQALFFMNSPMAVDVARKATSRPEFLAAKDDAGRVKALYEVLFQRAPRPDEVSVATSFIKSQQQSAGPVAQRPDAGDNDNRPGKALRRRLAQQKIAGGGKGGDGRKAVKNDGEFVERKPLTPWEEYAQALLFTNELAYVN